MAPSVVAKLRTSLATAVLGIVSIAGPVQAQFKAPINLSLLTVNIGTGTCTTAAGTGKFPISSWNWAEQNPSNIAVGGGTTGRVNLQDLGFTKNFDGCSAELAQDSATGKHVPTVTLQQYDTNNNLVLTVALGQVIVTSYQISGTTTSAGPAETVFLNFGTIKITNSSLATFCWDAVANKVCQ